MVTDAIYVYGGLQNRIDTLCICGWRVARHMTRLFGDVSSLIPVVVYHLLVYLWFISFFILHICLILELKFTNLSSSIHIINNRLPLVFS